MGAVPSRLRYVLEPRKPITDGGGMEGTCRLRWATYSYMETENRPAEKKKNPHYMGTPCIADS